MEDNKKSGGWLSDMSNIATILTSLFTVGAAIGAVVFDLLKWFLLFFFPVVLVLILLFHIAGGFKITKHPFKIAYHSESFRKISGILLFVLLLLVVTVLFIPSTGDIIQSFFFPTSYAGNGGQIIAGTDGASSPSPVGTVPATLPNETVMPIITFTPTSTLTLIPTAIPTATSTVTATIVPTLTSTPCLSEAWIVFPSFYSTLVQKETNGCQNFREIRTTLNGRNLSIYVNPSTDTGIMGIYKLLPEGAWHKVFTIHINKMPVNSDGRPNQFFIGLIDPVSSKLSGAYLEISTGAGNDFLTRKFAGKYLKQSIFKNSVIILDCSIDESRKTICNLVIDGVPVSFEDIPGSENIKAFFIGYSVNKGGTLDIVIEDNNDEPFFR